MATAPTFPIIPVAEYLRSSYRPDMEYIDGILVERSVSSLPPSILQMLLIEFFFEHRKRLRFLALPEIRTQIVERARYRIPDILLCSLPIPDGRVVDTIPGSVIEILSPEDRMVDILARFSDYAGIGVRGIVLLDPERYVAHRYEDGSLIRTVFHELPLAGGAGPVPFPSDELFDRLRSTLGAE